MRWQRPLPLPHRLNKLSRMSLLCNCLQMGTPDHPKDCGHDVAHHRSPCRGLDSTTTAHTVVKMQDMTGHLVVPEVLAQGRLRLLQVPQPHDGGSHATMSCLKFLGFHRITDERRMRLRAVQQCSGSNPCHMHDRLLLAAALYATDCKP